MSTIIVRNRDGSKQRIYETDFDTTKHIRLTGLPSIPEEVAELVTDPEASEREKLLARAGELRIKHHPNIGNDKLRARIEAAEAS